MATPPTQTQVLQLALDTACQLLVYVELACANPTQANVDAMVTTASRSNLLVLPPKQSDGTYNWTAYRDSLINTMSTLRVQLQRSSGPIWSPLVYGRGYGGG
jgi:hypothetical protein